MIGPRSTNIPQPQGILHSIGVRKKPITIDSAVRDDGNTGETTKLRPGLVLVLNAAGTKYINTDDAAAPGGTPAIVTAQETADGDWAEETLTFDVDGVPIEVTLGANDDTDAEVVTALNGDADFAAVLIADVSSSRVRVRTREGGPDAYVKATASIDSIFGEDGQEDQGSLPTAVVLEEAVDLEDWDSGDATAVAIYARGRFDESALLELTEDTKRALELKGCLFE